MEFLTAFQRQTRMANLMRFTVSFKCVLPDGYTLKPGNGVQINDKSVHWPWTVTPGDHDGDIFDDSTNVIQDPPFEPKTNITIQIMAEGSEPGSEPEEHVSMETSDVLP
jgi:hypothetical protein